MIVRELRTHDNSLFSICSLLFSGTAAELNYIREYIASVAAAVAVVVVMAHYCDMLSWFLTVFRCASFLWSSPKMSSMARSPLVLRAYNEIRFKLANRKPLKWTRQWTWERSEGERERGSEYKLESNRSSMNLCDKSNLFVNRHEPYAHTVVHCNRQKTQPTTVDNFRCLSGRDRFLSIVKASTIRVQPRVHRTPVVCSTSFTFSAATASDFA